VEAAKQRGLTVPALAARLRLSPLEVMKLNQRLFRPDSIPGSLVRRLADAVGQTVESVAGYLQLPPTLSAQASYKAESTPRLAEQAGFAEAVESSRALPDHDRAYWLDQVKTGGTSMEG
jgi:hypothetical protein